MLEENIFDLLKKRLVEANATIGKVLKFESLFKQNQLEREVRSFDDLVKFFNTNVKFEDALEKNLVIRKQDNREEASQLQYKYPRMKADLTKPEKEQLSVPDFNLAE